MDRVLVLIGLGLLLLVLVAGGRRLAGRRLAALRAQGPHVLWRALGAEPDGRPVIVSFSSPGCTDCRVQRPVVESLAGSGVRVFELDAAGRPELARLFGVLTAPTTVVLDPGGQVLAVNNGLAGADLLSRQLQLSTAG